LHQQGFFILSSGMNQHVFAEKVVSIVKEDDTVIGLAAAGSWITNEIDEFSDLDLILVTTNKIASDKKQMLGYANRFGTLVSAFTGEHVGEPRLLICLYEDPLLHVDIKFITLPEFEIRVEDPVVLFERNGQLTQVIKSTNSEWPQPDLQWMEDRIWTWVHYITGKIGRGEYFEAIDGLGIIRKIILSPFLQIKNNKLPNGLRKIEMQLPEDELASLRATVPQYNKAFLVQSLDKTIVLYRKLRKELFPAHISLQSKAEALALNYFNECRDSITG
jgi:hypothetical protein